MKLEDKLDEIEYWQKILDDGKASVGAVIEIAKLLEILEKSDPKMTKAIGRQMKIINNNLKETAKLVTGRLTMLRTLPNE
jgi:hypothetical protein